MKTDFEYFFKIPESDLCVVGNKDQYWVAKDVETMAGTVIFTIGEPMDKKSAIKSVIDIEVPYDTCG